MVRIRIIKAEENASLSMREEDKTFEAEEMARLKNGKAERCYRLLVELTLDMVMGYKVKIVSLCKQKARVYWLEIRHELPYQACQRQGQVALELCATSMAHGQSAVRRDVQHVSR